MKFIENLTEKEYMDFFKENPNAHFLQSAGWGYASKLNRQQTPIYVGLKDENDRILIAALLLKKNTPFKMCYYYCPRGFVFDYKNKNIFDVFIKELKNLLKKTNAIYLKVDPGIKYQTIDSEAKPIEGENNYEIFNWFIETGFKHQGFNKLHEGNQPRYTFRIPVDISEEEIKNKISKSFMKQINKSFSYDFEIIESENTDNFSKLNELISQKDDFHFYGSAYFKNVYDGFNKYDEIKVHEVKLYPTKIIAKNEIEINKIEKELQEGLVIKKNLDNTNNTLKRLKREVELLLPYKNEKEGLIICSMIVVYTKDILWTLYIGNNDLARDLFAVNRIYYEELLYAKKIGCKYVDLFGVVGDPHTKEKNYAGIYNYKANFGGIYTEFLGEFDLINKSFMYKVLPSLLKIYRKMLKKVKK